MPALERTSAGACHSGIPRSVWDLSVSRPPSCQEAGYSQPHLPSDIPQSSRCSTAQTQTTPLHHSIPSTAMSGFEVVGIVLGALPIAVKAAQGYMAILSSVKDAHRNLKALIRDLETENIRLQTTCELLLDGIAPPSVVDKLIQTPFGPDWKPYNDQLRLRLWTTAGKFEEQVVEMRNAADELRAKLCLEPDGSVGLFLPHLDIGRTDRVDRPNSLIVWLSAES